MERNIFFSVIIPAFNESALIGETIKRVGFAIEEAGVARADWELIVCDNASTDQTAEIAAAMGARVVKEPIRHISRARNTGARGARGNWLMFLDADTYPSPELVVRILALIEGETCIGCGTTVVVEGGTLFNKLRMERLNPIFRFFNISGGALIICRRKAFEAIGGFSRHLYALEDIDFVFRLKRFGRSHGETFKVLARYPAITSGRRGEFDLMSLVRLFVSNFAAVILFGLQYLLPKHWVAALGEKTLGYWYRSRS